MWNAYLKASYAVNEGVVDELNAKDVAIMMILFAF